MNDPLDERLQKLISYHQERSAAEAQQEAERKRVAAIAEEERRLALDYANALISVLEKTIVAVNSRLAPIAMEFRSRRLDAGLVPVAVVEIQMFQGTRDGLRPLRLEFHVDRQVNVLADGENFAIQINDADPKAAFRELLVGFAEKTMKGDA